MKVGEACAVAVDKTSGCANRSISTPAGAVATIPNASSASGIAGSTRAVRKSNKFRVGLNA